MGGDVAVLGTGLIGGSVALGLRAAGRRVVGYDRDPAVLEEGLRRGAFDGIAEEPAEAARDAELVVIAAPVDATEALCAAISADIDRRTVVTDVGSAKGGVVNACEPLLGARFVGGHPMAGSERHGIAAADPLLFQDAWWIVTPTRTTSSAAYRTVSALATALGARPVALDPVDHDRLLARLSHLPQLVSSALVAAAVASEDKESLLGLAAGGFRDVTRIAASDPALWVTILRANREAVLEALDEYKGSLEEIGRLLADQRYDALEGYLGRSRSARRDLFGKPELHDVPVTLTMQILDRPGVLAEVTTAAGALGANIEDLRIVHSTEGGRGRLELIVAGEDPAARLAAELTELGYRVERGRPE
jgi:prephenate dehydrogenase